MEEQKNNQSKLYFLLGIMAGVAVISVLGFFAVLSILYSNKGPVEKVLAQNNVNAVANVNTNPTPTPTEPQADASKLAPVTEADHVRGDFNAPVTLLLFSDYQCPYCLAFEATLDQVMTDYKGKVRLVFRNFPLSFHENAEKAAEAAECASEQGKFWEMHDKIFAANKAGTMSVAQWKTDAKDLGLDTSKFDNCLDTGKTAGKVSAELAEGSAAGVNGTPATFINGELVSGALPYASIKQIIDSKLK